MSTRAPLWLLLALLSYPTRLGLADTKSLYENNFTQAEVGKVPGDMLVLDGAFAVRQEGDEKFLELPGAPLDSYGVLFASAEKEGVCVAARVFGTAKGRRFPTFGLGLNGASGYRLVVAPGKKALELYKGDTVEASVPFDWASGEWTQLRLRVRKTGEKAWKIEGKAWAQNATEPTAWTVSWDESEPPRAGKAALFGNPFSGTPIRYDDLSVKPVPE